MNPAGNGTDIEDFHVYFEYMQAEKLAGTA